MNQLSTLNPFTPAQTPKQGATQSANNPVETRAKDHNPLIDSAIQVEQSFGLKKSGFVPERKAIARPKLGEIPNITWKNITEFVAKSAEDISQHITKAATDQAGFMGIEGLVQQPSREDKIKYVRAKTPEISFRSRQQRAKPYTEQANAEQLIRDEQVADEFRKHRKPNILEMIGISVDDATAVRDAHNRVLKRRQRPNQLSSTSKQGGSPGSRGLKTANRESGVSQGLPGE